MRAKQPASKKKPNWVSDETLHWSEKAFHAAVALLGSLLFAVVLKSLWDLAHDSAHGAVTAVLAVVLMLLIAFAFFCMSGRGVEVMERLRDKIENAEYIKLWGFVLRSRLPREEAK